MKSVFKFLGIIAIVAVIGFGLVSCDDGDGGSKGGGAKIRVVNQHAKSITVELTPYGKDNITSPTIASGASWEGSIPPFDTIMLAVGYNITFDGNDPSPKSGSRSVEPGETVTLTVTIAGDVQ